MYSNGNYYTKVFVFTVSDEALWCGKAQKQRWV